MLEMECGKYLFGEKYPYNTINKNGLESAVFPININEQAIILTLNIAWKKNIFIYLLSCKHRPNKSKLICLKCHCKLHIYLGIEVSSSAQHKLQQRGVTSHGGHVTCCLTFLVGYGDITSFLYKKFGNFNVGPEKNQQQTRPECSLIRK